MADKNVSFSCKLKRSSWRGQWRAMSEVVEKEGSSLRCCKVVYNLCISIRGKIEIGWGYISIWFC